MAEAELSTISRPYARAAFAYALDQADGLAHWAKMLQLLAAVLNEPVVTDALDNPLLTTDAEMALLVDIMGDDLSEDGSNFVGVLAENNRLALLPTISEQFELLKSNHEKTLDVMVTSAFEVSSEDQEKLAGALREKLQRDINIDTSVDKALIGGVVIKTEDTVIDDSVKGRLDRLSHALS